MPDYPDVAAYLVRLKALLGVQSDQQLADTIGVAKQTISSWRQRNKLPLSVESELSDRFGPEAAFSNFMRYATDRREDFIVYALFRVIRQRYGALLPQAAGPKAEVAWGEALVHAEPALRRAIRQIGFDYLKREEVFSAIAGRIERDEIDEVIRGVDVYVRLSFHPELPAWTIDDPNNELDFGFEVAPVPRGPSPG